MGKEEQGGRYIDTQVKTAKYPAPQISRSKYDDWCLITRMWTLHLHTTNACTRKLVKARNARKLVEA